VRDERAKELPPAQLRMVWKDETPALSVAPPPGYRLRTYRPGDEARFFELMALAGWPEWHAGMLPAWQARLLPGGWFLAVEEGSELMVATAMAYHDRKEFGRPGGEIGWIAADPAHWGKGLGLVVAAAATERHRREGYGDIHLYTEEFRLAALKSYLKLGYVPLLYTPEMAQRWRAICRQLDWPYSPEEWERK
jgi:mycothiol synthase